MASVKASKGENTVATVLITGHGIPNAVASAGDRYQESMEQSKVAHHTYPPLSVILDYPRVSRSRASWFASQELALN